MKIEKIIRPALNVAICLIAIIVCLCFGGKFEAAAASTNGASGKDLKSGGYLYIDTDHSKYGGDAYTGIQNAAADTADNVATLGSNVTDAANLIYGAEKVVADNLDELSAPINDAAANTAAIGSLLCTAIAFAFAIPFVKNLLDLVLFILQEKGIFAAAAEV